VLIPSSHDLACLVEPLAIHLDPTEPSGDMEEWPVICAESESTVWIDNNSVP
jgi:hypothetical protein